ncbi:EAL domain-containing protein [Solirubrobacter sp. CPCC 204708]|uniref:EAL domain-containing protein n=1 Tax=Solirubrobacter deserti TaxID=2282478 RepID=A0ABT4RNK9_9ACTN|nr:diguanylate cyclase [Solirubrobacter deserti]MBE2318406.1 EAL domain-containing protein [Solirubrobacter deserti]MDA0140075.1 EAL domain-containing protein [Solirubrobacter deserti]
MPAALETERGAALEALVDAASGILAADSLDGTLGRIAHHLQALLRYDDLTVYEVDEALGVLRPVFAVGNWVDEALADPIPLGTGVTGWVVEHRRTRNVPNSGHEPLCSVVGGTDDEPEAFVCVPLLARERVVGALNVYRALGSGSFSAAEVELVERFATMAALAYDSARQRETLRDQVQRDGLTGLLNHRACHERLKAALNFGDPVAVVLLDLDHFKVINDTLGHAEGDRVLKACAERLRSVVRTDDVVGRMGGEEFALILPGADVEAAEDCAERARAALAELTVRGRPVAASAGVAAAPADGAEAPVLLENADAALYWAKRSGRGKTVRYKRGAIRPEAEQRNEIAELLERGVEAIEIVVQPVVELATGRAGGYEALTRINVEPRRGPDEWFAQAHRVGLGDELEALAMRAALALPDRPDGAFLALNVSPRALLSAPVQDILPATLTGIVVELTEHEVFGAAGELDAALADLRARGARIALDDAGAGYAGLQQMIRIAPEILKLDRTLVHGAHADGSRQALLEALIGFASSTGAAICAEGVEDLDDLRALVALDVTYAQGYGLCRPAPAWPQPDAAATAAAESEIRSGLRISGNPRGAGAFTRGLAELSDELSAAETVHDLGEANVRAAALLGADELALLLVEGDEIELVSKNRVEVGERWSLDDFPSTRYVLEHRIPGQVVVGDEAGDPAELAELAELGLGTVLLVPVICSDQPVGLLEIYRVRRQAFTAREVDRARVLAQQFGAALDRLPS